MNIIDEKNIRNKFLFKFLGVTGEAVTQLKPNEHANPYYSAGAHPDTVERLWGELGTKIKEIDACIFSGYPALVSKKGVVIGFARGTNYYLLISPNEKSLAASSGLINASIIGEFWVVGAYKDQEIDLIKKSIIV